MSGQKYVLKRTSLKHRGGTKEYHLVLIVTPQQTGILIRRFGKVGAFGEVMVEQFNNALVAEANYCQLLLKKTAERKGYSKTVSNSTECDFDELQKRIGRPLWAKLSPANIRFLNADADVTGVREPDPPRFDEEGRWLGNPEPRKADLTAEIEAAKAARLEELRQKNPLYGRF